MGELIANRTLDILLKQIFEDGFFQFHSCLQQWIFTGAFIQNIVTQVLDNAGSGVVVFIDPVTKAGETEIVFFIFGHINEFLNVTAFVDLG